jgi:glycosyltransferase involved in cell wall biosynthesis
MNELDSNLSKIAPAPPSVPAKSRTTDEVYDRALATLDTAEAGLKSLESPSQAPPKPKLGVKLSVVIPVFNERDTIRQVVERVRASAKDADIVIVDDCSTDGTRDVLLELDKLPGVRIVMHGYNKGKGAALRTAFDHAQGQVILIQDADLEYNPADYAKLIKPIADGMADVVYGSRFLENPRQDPSWLHRFGNKLLTRTSNLTTGLRLTDMETCYKVFRRGVLRGMELREQRFGFEPEFTAKLARRRCRITEVPISYNSRGKDEGKKIGLRDAFRALYCIVRYALWD